MMDNPFGLPQPNFGDQPLTQAPDYSSMASVPTNFTAPKTGMFGGSGNGGFGLRQALAFGLAGLVSRRNPALLQGLMQMMSDKRQQAAEDARAQANRQSALQDQMALYKFKQDNPGPLDDQLTQHMIAAGIDPNSEQGKAFYRNSLDPVVMTAQGPMLRSQLLGAGQPAPQGVTFTPIDGGPTPQASGGFPY